jgi:quinol monooxygenase YgiN
MSELRLSVRCDIHEGHLDDFEKAAAACLDIVRTKDSGTLQYTWYMNEDRTRCISLERYVDSDAFLEHLANLGDTFSELLDTCVLKVDLFGHPSDELLAATEAVPKRIYTFYQGT